MNSTSESLSPPETRNGRAAEGNCVIARWGGKQPEADLRSQTKVNPIRPITVASLLASGEACRMSGDCALHINSSKETYRLLRVFGVRTQGRAHEEAWRAARAEHPRERSRAAVRAAIVVMKRSNVRGAKGGRKVDRQGA